MLNFYILQYKDAKVMQFLHFTCVTDIIYTIQYFILSDVYLTFLSPRVSFRLRFKLHLRIYKF